MRSGLPDEEQRRPRRATLESSCGGRLEHDNLVLAEVTAREIGRVTIAEALELTALVARKHPHRYCRFAARWLCLRLEKYERVTLDDVALLVSTLPSLATPTDHAAALAIRRKVARRGLTSPFTAVDL